MERVSLFVDLYNFLNTSKEYLNQKCYVDFIEEISQDGVRIKRILDKATKIELEEETA